MFLKLCFANASSVRHKSLPVFAVYMSIYEQFLGYSKSVQVKRRAWSMQLLSPEAAAALLSHAAYEAGYWIFLTDHT